MNENINSPYFYSCSNPVYSTHCQYGFNKHMETNKQLLSVTSHESLGITSRKPKFPQYAVVSKRQDSYKSWPEYLPLKPECLVDAGLVYTGVGDSVRCYFCGGGLRNWDRDDSPWVEHAKWYPDCPHVLLVKGQNYVERVAKGENPDKEMQQPESQKICETDHLNTPAALSCLQNGFPKRLVERAISTYKATHKHPNFKGTDLCKIIFEIEEEEARTTTTANDANTNTENVDAATGCDDNCQDSLEELYEENRRLKDNTLCKICLDDAATIIFLPCGHMVSCPRCAPALVKCPVCRMAVRGFVRAYFATSIK